MQQLVRLGYKKAYFGKRLFLMDKRQKLATNHAQSHHTNHGLIPDALLARTFDLADKRTLAGIRGFYPLFMKSEKLVELCNNPKELAASTPIELVLTVYQEAQDLGMSSRSSHTLIGEERFLRPENQNRARWIAGFINYIATTANVSYRAIETLVPIEMLIKDFMRYGKIVPAHSSYEEAYQCSIDVYRPYSSARKPTALVRARLKKKLTQQALSKMSGVGLRAIQQYEQRQKDINHAHAYTVFLLAQALDCSMEQLIEPKKK